MTGPRFSPVAAVGLLAAVLVMATAAPVGAQGGGSGIRSVWDDPAQVSLRGQRVVALTFDDGPDPRWTPQILDILDRYGVPGTFFPVGRLAAARPDLVRRTLTRGHVVGNHTWSHADLSQVGQARLAAEIDQAQRALTSITGAGPRCVRPPYGSLSPAATSAIRSRWLQPALWSVDTRDWSRPGAWTIFQRAVGAARPGSVILMHDGGGDRSQTVRALPVVIETLARRGFRFTTICGAPSTPVTALPGG